MPFCGFGVHLRIKVGGKNESEREGFHLSYLHMPDRMLHPPSPFDDDDDDGGPVSDACTRTLPHPPFFLSFFPFFLSLPCSCAAYTHPIVTVRCAHLPQFLQKGERNTLSDANQQTNPQTVYGNLTPTGQMDRSSFASPATDPSRRRRCSGSCVLAPRGGMRGEG